ncbi:MAG: flavin reductase family protein [Desulfosarcinaceae bacterium]|nr:flavin reductase family protein [Desulfosarcinaceae bacterium]
MEAVWQKALGRMNYGIYVLTTRSAEIVNGMIASWVSQISHTPPLIMAAIHPNRYTHTLLDDSEAFALHVLDRSQQEMLHRFKGPDAALKYDGIDWLPGQTGSPVLRECLAWLECRVVDRLAPGNHTLFIAEVVAAGCPAEGDPLTTRDYEGQYTGRV